MKKQSLIMILCLKGSLVLGVLLECSLRNSQLRSRLSVISQGHLFHRVQHISELKGPVPGHYPVHSLESQLLVFSNEAYIGYLSTDGVFVPDGIEKEATTKHHLYLMAFLYYGRWMFWVLAIVFGTALYLKQKKGNRQQKG